MAGFREQFVKGSKYIIPFISLERLRDDRFLNKPLFTVYHTVSDRPLSHIHNLYKVKNTKQFRQDLDFLLRNFTPISYNDFQLAVNEGKSLKKNSFLLTFDDGLKEFYDVISPILLEKGIPAICFLNSDFIDNSGLFYRYKASLLIDDLKTKIVSTNLIETWNKTYFKSNRTIENILSVNYNNQEALDNLALILGFDFQLYLKEEQPYLNTIQIKELIAKGFEFGSHSCSHPEYQSISIEEQILQTSKSMTEIQEKFGLNYRTFAFPFTDYGVDTIFFEEIFQKQIIDISFACAGIKNTKYKQHFHRLPLEEGNLSAEKIIKSTLLYERFKAFIR